VQLLRSEQAQSEGYRQQLVSLRDDNIKLYEKLQYVKNFRASSSSQQVSHDQGRSRDWSSGLTRAPIFLTRVSDCTLCSQAAGLSKVIVEKPGASSVSGATGAAATAVSGDNSASAGGSDVETRYRPLYEEKMNPFREFKQRQQAERYKTLPATEKITLNLGRFFLSKKYARTFVFFYALVLHVLVFFTLWTHTVTPHC